MKAASVGPALSLRLCSVTQVQRQFLFVLFICGFKDLGVLRGLLLMMLMLFERGEGVLN